LRGSRSWRRGLALCASVSLLGVSLAFTGGGVALAAGAGSVSGTGMIPVGADTLTITVDASVDASGAVSGTFSGSADSGFSVPDGVVTCLVVVGNSVVVGGTGTASGVGTGSIVFFLTDNGATGDTLSVNAFSTIGPADCGAVMENAPTALSTGDYTVSGTSGPPPTTGTLSWSSEKSTGGLLGGVTFRVASPGAGVDLTLTDDDSNDTDSTAGLVAVAWLPIG
jgi:hypothetical protein